MPLHTAIMATLPFNVQLKIVLVADGWCFSGVADSDGHHLEFRWEGSFGVGGLVVPPSSAIMVVSLLPFNALQCMGAGGNGTLLQLKIGREMQNPPPRMHDHGTV